VTGERTQRPSDASPPVVAIAVDDVLNPDNPARAVQQGYQPHRYDGPDPHGLPSPAWGGCTPTTAMAAPSPPTPTW
jgi:hypothetical protein